MAPQAPDPPQADPNAWKHAPGSAENSWAERRWSPLCGGPRSQEQLQRRRRGDQFRSARWSALAPTALHRSDGGNRQPLGWRQLAKVADMPEHGPMSAIV